MLVTFRLFHSRSLLFTFQQFSFHLLLLSNVFTRSNYLLSPPHCSLFFAVCIASLHKIYCAITMSISRLRRRCFYFTNTHKFSFNHTAHKKFHRLTPLLWITCELNFIYRFPIHFYGVPMYEEFVALLF